MLPSYLSQTVGNEVHFRRTYEHSHTAILSSSLSWDFTSDWRILFYLIYFDTVIFKRGGTLE